MIRIILRHQTGNQLFLYAIGRYLSLKNSTDLVLDTSSYGRFYKKYCHLPRLNLDVKFTSPLPSRACKKYFGKYFWEINTGPLYVEEQRHLYDERILDLKAPHTLYGLFQSPKYFDKIQSIIRQELDFEHLIQYPDSIHVLEKIKSHSYVSVHIRRTDYFNNLKYHYVCTPAYYEKSMSYFRERIKNVRFLVCSDDIQWCKTQFLDSDVEFLETEYSSKDPFNDLYIMSQCSHNIIANSTYSWWGAWLNDNHNKIVITPYYWMNDKNVLIEDKILPNWIPLKF